jgi:hypothetical protein
MLQVILMVRFRDKFLEQFPSLLRSQLQSFASFINGWETLLERAPDTPWPPPEPLLDAFDYHVEILWQANGVKAVNLCSGIVQSLNESNFLCFAVLFRAFFEQTLLVRQYFSSRLLPTINSCSKKGLVQTDELSFLIKELHMSVRRSKLDWDKLLKGSLDGPVKDTEVFDKVGLIPAAKQWEKDGAKLGAFTPTGLYAVLCDVAHPNFGSSLMCMKLDGFGFARPRQSSTGAKIFGLLYPSLGAVATEFQKIQNELLSLKFHQ